MGWPMMFFHNQSRALSVTSVTSYRRAQLVHKVEARTTFTIPLALGIFLLGAASGGLLTHLRWMAVAARIREQMAEQLGDALHAKRRLARVDWGGQSKTDRVVSQTAVASIREAERSESRSARLHANEATASPGTDRAAART
jgi:hypothetical protein